MSYPKVPISGKNVKELTFMTGAWQGRTETDFFEEQWTGEVASNMTGMFRWMKEGKVFIYEIMALVEQHEKIQLLLRHFDKDFKGWEEKDRPMVFDLTKLADKMAVFINPDKPDAGFIKYELVDDDTLKFEDINPDGTVNFSLTFKRWRRTDC